MPRVLPALAAALVTLAPALAGAESAPPAPGVARQQLTTPGGRQLGLTIWYPAAGPGAPVKIGGNAVFEGTAGADRAPVADGRHPLVVLSHGGLRSAPDSGAWLAARLAQAGFFVVAEHGPRLAPTDAGKAVQEIAERPADMRAALAAVIANPHWSAHLAPGKVAAVGVFLGGTAALQLAGARIDTAAFARVCDAGEGAAGVDCGWFRAGGLNLHGADLSALAAPMRAPKVAYAIAVAPEYAAQIAPASLSRPGAAPVAILDLGAPGDGPEGQRGAALKDVAASYADLARVTRFDTFPDCTPKGPAILKGSGMDAPICDDRGPARRAAHAALAGRIAGLLNAQFR